MAFNRLANRIIKQDLAEEARLNYMSDVIPDKINDYIQPVIVVGKKYCDLVKYNTATNTTGTAIYTTPLDKDCYISTVILSCTKDVTSTSVRSAITATVQGTVIRLAHMAFTTLVVQNNANVVVNFPIPVKIDRGTAINVTNSTNVANVTSDAIIIGYLSDTATAGS